MALPALTLTISAEAVAWYGAIIATLAAVVSIYNVWRDRPRIALEFGKNFRRIEAWDEPLFFISVINRGRRPVRFEKAWVKVYGYSGEVLLTDSLNTTQERTLDERNPKITFWTKHDTLNVQNIYRIYASDEAGRIYKKYIKTLPTFTRFWWTITGKRTKV